MLPDLNRLYVFFHVYSRLSIKAAAERLHITSPAVSQHIKKLEAELKAPLFTRLHKRLVPTPAGTRLFGCVEPMIKGLQAGMETFDTARNEPSGVLRIGAPVEFGSIYLPHVMSSYRRRYPSVTFELVLGRPSFLLPAVSAGDLDFALVDTFPTRKQYSGDVGHLSITPVIEEAVVLACSGVYNGERLGNDHTFGRLAGQSYISQQQDARALNNWFRYHFGKAAPQLEIVLTVASHQAVLSAVRHHMGLGIIVSHLVPDEIQSGAIVVVRDGKPQATNKISIVQLLDKVPTLTEKSFLDHFNQRIRNSKTLRLFNLCVNK